MKTSPLSTGGHAERRATNEEGGGVCSLFFVIRVAIDLNRNAANSRAIREQ